MTDVLTPEERRKCMSNIKGKDTKPEIIVRKIAHRLGYRFRLNVKNLPGKPDLVFPGRKKVIFVHGCFWHMHNCRYGKVKPKTRATFWAKKRKSNTIRDKKCRLDLKKLGWQSLIIWECWTNNEQKISSLLKTFLQ